MRKFNTGVVIDSESETLFFRGFAGNSGFDPLAITKNHDMAIHVR